MSGAGWTKRVPQKEGAFWRRTMCTCGQGWNPPEVVHLVKSKKTSGALSVNHPLGEVVAEDPATNWIHNPVSVPGGV